MVDLTRVPVDPSDPYDCVAYDLYCEEMAAIEDGTAMRLTECEKHGLVGIVDDSGVCYGFNRAASARVGYDGDPYTVLTLSCGCKQI